MNGSTSSLSSLKVQFGLHWLLPLWNKTNQKNDMNAPELLHSGLFKTAGAAEWKMKKEKKKDTTLLCFPSGFAVWPTEMYRRRQISHFLSVTSVKFFSKSYVHSSVMYYLCLNQETQVNEVLLTDCVLICARRRVWYNPPGAQTLVVADDPADGADGALMDSRWRERAAAGERMDLKRGVMWTAGM